MKKAFGESLRRMRMRKGLTQQQLASRLKVDRTSVTNWETGRHMPDVATISLLADALGVDTAALMAAVQEPIEVPNILLVDDKSVFPA